MTLPKPGERGREKPVIKVRKKGKTVGRRSRAEAIWEAVLYREFAKPSTIKRMKDQMVNTLKNNFGGVDKRQSHRTQNPTASKEPCRFDSCRRQILRR